MIDVLNAGAPAPGSSRGLEITTRKSDENQGFANAVEHVKKSDSDGKLLPEDDKTLPVIAPDELSVNEIDEIDDEIASEVDEPELLDEVEFDGSPVVPQDIRSATATSSELIVESDLKIEGGDRTKSTAGNLLKGNIDASAGKLELSLAQPDSKDLSIADSRDSDFNDKRMMTSELKSITQNRTEVSVPVKVTDPGWQEGIAQRVTMLISQRNSLARIHINPPELGPVEVRLNVNHDQASVQFLSHSSQVRDALEQSIPRLRDMLESAGIELSDSHVGEQNHPGSENKNHDWAPGTNDLEAAGFGHEEVQVSHSMSEALLDAYA